MTKYNAIWSKEDQAYIGLYTEFPSLSWLANSQVEAIEGIKKLVEEIKNELALNSINHIENK